MAFTSISDLSQFVTESLLDHKNQILYLISLVKTIESLYIKEQEICFDFYKKCENPEHAMRCLSKTILPKVG